ncbi:hypothetical protein FsymDg_1870 [Candidatus Protofrankia datiscae]|uniref:Uncharacterized protein n=1 Tax=Candidatus Protofrankia datiscae TaxID=2716812 RepID=F8AVY9_9ACTN|nr:hypothetical protein FsymDg_1870 [Candidatus Protofrankia datiscae]
MDGEPFGSGSVGDDNNSFGDDNNAAGNRLASATTHTDHDRCPSTRVAVREDTDGYMISTPGLGGLARAHGDTVSDSL